MVFPVSATLPPARPIPVVVRQCQSRMSTKRPAIAAAAKGDMKAAMGQFDAIAGKRLYILDYVELGDMAPAGVTNKLLTGWFAACKIITRKASMFTADCYVTPVVEGRDPVPYIYLPGLKNLGLVEPICGEREAPAEVTYLDDGSKYWCDETGKPRQKKLPREVPSLY